MRNDRSVLSAAVARVETLERRSLLSTVANTSAGSDTSGPDLTAALARGGADHGAAWYKPVRHASGDATGDSAPVFSTNAAGLPLLTSRPDGIGLKVFLDFDGNGSNLPFGIDADDTTFNAAEQTAIYTHLARCGELLRDVQRQRDDDPATHRRHEPAVCLAPHEQVDQRRLRERQLAHAHGADRIQPKQATP